MPLLPKFDKFEDLFSKMLSEAPLGDWNPDVRVSAGDVSPKHYYFEPMLKKMKVPEEEWGEKLQDLTDAVVDEIGKHLDAEGEWGGSRKEFVSTVAAPAVGRVAQRFMTGREDGGDVPFKFSNVASWNARVIVAAALKAGKVAEKKKASGKVVVKVDAYRRPAPKPTPRPQPPRERTYDITCSSKDKNYAFCSAPGLVRGYLVNKHSDASCREGRSFWFTREGVHVDKGCRATFRVTTRR